MEHHQPRRKGRRPAPRKPATAKLLMERLEERLVLSGFGPQDGAYIVEPWSGSYSDVQIQPGDQKVVAAGDMIFTNPDGSTEGRVAVARYDSLGNADTAYGSGGLSAPALGPSSESGNRLVLQSDGKAVVSVDANFSLAVARFTANGSIDSGFGNGGWNSFNVQPGRDSIGYGVGLQSTGKIVVSGSAFTSTASSAFVARFTASGAIDSGKGGFGTVVQGKATGATLSTFGYPYNGFGNLAIQPDDKLVAIGDISIDGNTERVVVARYTASGALDKTFNGNGYSVFVPGGINTVNAWAGALQSDGKIVIAGGSSGIDGAADMFVTRFNANGTLDTGFGGGSGYVRFDVDGTATQTYEDGRDVVIQSDGKIVVVGRTATPGSPGSSKVLLVRFSPDGTPDQTFAAGGFKLGAPAAGTGYHDFFGYAVSLQSDGSIIVAGQDDWGTSATTAHPLLMRFLPTPSSPIQAAGGAAPAASQTKPLTLAQMQPLLTEAVAPWQAAAAESISLGSPVTERAALVPYDASGNLDPSFGTGGILTTALSPNGKHWVKSPWKPWS